MYWVQRAHRASICSHPSMLQCLGWSLEGALPEAESIKWSSSNRRLSCDTRPQNRSSVGLGSLKITSENFSWNQLANRLFTLTSLFVQAWDREWNHNVWSAEPPSQRAPLKEGIMWMRPHRTLPLRYLILVARARLCVGLICVCYTGCSLWSTCVH